MANTLIGVFNNLEDAVEAREKLREKGFADSEIKLQRDPAVMGSEGPDSQRQGVASWLSSLFSLDEDYVGMYSEAVRRGLHVLAVDARNQQEVDTAAEIMERCRCVDIDESAAGWRNEGWKEQRGAASARGPQPVTLRKARVISRP